MLWPALTRQVYPDRWGPSAAVRRGLELLRYEIPAASEPAPLTKIGVLRWAGRGDLDIGGLAAPPGGRGVQIVISNTAGRDWLADTGGGQRHLQWAVDVATRCRVEILELPWGFGSCDAAASAVESWAASASAAQESGR
jgi:hypothetical protein